MRGPERALVVLSAALLAVGTACAADNTDGPPATRVDAVMTDESVRLEPAETPEGPVTFVVSNQGTVTHELEVFRTDLAADALPVDDGVVTTELQPLDEVENVEPGSSVELAVTLEPGRYALICNLPGHYVQGMWAGFSVG